MSKLGKLHKNNRNQRSNSERIQLSIISLLICWGDFGKKLFMIVQLFLQAFKALTLTADKTTAALAWANRGVTLSQML